MSSSTFLSTSSLNLENLPDNPLACSQIQESHALLGNVRKIQAESNDANNEAVKKIYRKALSGLLPIYELVKEKKNSTFPSLWAHFFKWKALCELALGMEEHAESSWMRYVEIIPKQALDKEKTSRFFYELGCLARNKENYQLAIQRFSQGIKIIGPRDLLLKERFAVRALLGHWEESIEDLIAAEKIHSNDPCILSFLGSYYKFIGEFQTAEVYLTQAEKLFHGKDAALESSCSEALNKMRYLKKIISSLSLGIKSTPSRTLDLEKKLIELLPTTQDKFYEDVYHLALAYKCSQEFAKAYVWLERAKAIAKTCARQRECAFLGYAIKSSLLSSAYLRLSKTVSQLAPALVRSASSVTLSSFICS